MCATVLTADRDNVNMLDVHMQAGSLCRETASTEMMSSGSIHAQTQKPLVSVYQGSGSSSAASTRMHGADSSKLAGRLHAMQADAIDRAWQKQQQSQRLAPVAAASSFPPSTAAAAAAASKCCHPSEAGPITVSAHALVGHSDVARQHSAAASQQVPTHSKRAATTASTAAARPAEPSLAPSAQPTADSHATCKPAAGVTTTSDIRTNKRPGDHGADLSTDAESLVAKLRALSQGRSDHAQSKASSKASGQQDQRYPFAPRATNSIPPKPIADFQAAPASKRSKQASTHITGAAAATSHAAAAIAAAGPTQLRPQPNTARCIQLLEPVHSGTEYGSGTSPERLSHCTHSHAASPAASNRPRSGYASVAAPIQLSVPTAQLPMAAFPRSVPAPTASAASAVAAAAAPAAAVPLRARHEQEPASPMQRRLGKPTPLKKGFTPKPTRFRLEAQRLSLTPPDKSSSLEKVLFRSPVKAAAAASQVSQGCNENPVAGCDIAAAPEAGPLVMREAEQWQGATGVGPDLSHPCSERMTEFVGSQAMVTPANSCGQVMQADPPAPALPQGVFAHMKVLLDPELSQTENHRYSSLLHVSAARPTVAEKPWQAMSRCIDPHASAGMW